LVHRAARLGRLLLRLLPRHHGSHGKAGHQANGGSRGRRSVVIVVVAAAVVVVRCVVVVVMLPVVLRLLSVVLPVFAIARLRRLAARLGFLRRTLARSLIAGDAVLSCRLVAGTAGLRLRTRFPSPASAACRAAPRIGPVAAETARPPSEGAAASGIAAETASIPETASSAETAASATPEAPGTHARWNR
jgi:hypothetical protein